MTLNATSGYNQQVILVFLRSFSLWKEKSNYLMRKLSGGYAKLSNIMTIKHRYHILLLILLINSFCLKLYYSEKYATYTDEILSSIVSESIAQHGIPRLPSGAIYRRAPLHHYMQAIPLALFGKGYVPMRINSILLSLLIILVIYLFGMRMASKKVGIAAAFLLSLNSVFNQYSLSGRMYMTYACTFILSFYFFHRGFLEGENCSKKLCLVFMVACMLSSEAGLIVGPIFGFLLCVYYKTQWVREKTIIIGAAIWMVLAYLILYYKIPNSLVAFTVHSGQPAARLVNLELPVNALIIKLSYIWRTLDACIPLSMPFFIVITLLLAKNRMLKQHFSLMVLIPGLIVQSFLSRPIQDRVLVTLIPLYILTCCHLASSLWMCIVSGLEKEGSFGKLLAVRRKQISVSVVAFCLLSAGFLTEKRMIEAARVERWDYRPFHDLNSKHNPEPAYDYVKRNASPKDVVIQTTLEYGLFFLGDDCQHYYIRQRIQRNKKGNIAYVSFAKTREPYYGLGIIDTIERLQEVIADTNSTIWLVLGHKSEHTVGPDLKGFIKKHFELAFYEKKHRVYVSQG